MKILLPLQVIQRLQRELRRAGRLEIGGLLMGQHVRDEIFRVADISVQRSGGSTTHFVRNPAEHHTQLAKFFECTGADYLRFNYLGEWHSHPSFDPLPSRTDIEVMQSIVDDPDVGVNFLILLIPRRVHRRCLQISGMGFRRNGEPFPLDVEVEGATKRFKTLWVLLRRLFTR